MSLTGPDAAFGEEFRDAATLAFKQVNAAGGIDGHKIEMIYGDSASDPATGVEVERKLIDQDHVVVIYGDIFTPVCLAMANVAQQAQVVNYNPGCTAPTLTTPFQKYVFAVNTTNAVENTSIVELLKSIPATKVGFLEESDSYGSTSLQGLQAAIKGTNITISPVESISATATDATTQLLAFKSAGDQAIVDGATVSPSAALVQATYSNSFTGPIVGYGGVSDPTVLNLLVKDDPIEFFGITPLACALTDPCVASFTKMWNAAYPKEAVNLYTPLAYAAAGALVQGLKAAPNYSPDGIVEGLESAPAYVTPTLPVPIKFTTTSHLGITKQVLYGYKNGKVFFHGTSLTSSTSN